MKFINYFIIMTIYYLRNIFSAWITYFQGFSIKYFMQYIILFKMLIYQPQKFFAYINIC